MAAVIFAKAFTRVKAMGATGASVYSCQGTAVNTEPGSLGEAGIRAIQIIF